MREWKTWGTHTLRSISYQIQEAVSSARNNVIKPETNDLLRGCFFAFGTTSVRLKVVTSPHSYGRMTTIYALSSRVRLGTTIIHDLCPLGVLFSLIGPLCRSITQASPYEKLHLQRNCHRQEETKLTGIHAFSPYSTEAHQRKFTVSVHLRPT